ncbi:hypothetical protein NL108_007038 [Boleophthalmus pectinirostris]|nr:hypothetical protein NL108_007038 [Boleophthalmus pectinirostris]
MAAVGREGTGPVQGLGIGSPSDWTLVCFLAFSSKTRTFTANTARGSASVVEVEWPHMKPEAVTFSSQGTACGYSLLGTSAVSTGQYSSEGLDITQSTTRHLMDN